MTCISTLIKKDDVWFVENELMFFSFEMWIIWSNYIGIGIHSCKTKESKENIPIGILSYKFSINQSKPKPKIITL